MMISLFIYYDSNQDGTGDQWIEIGAGPTGAQGTQGTQGLQGHQGLQGTQGVQGTQGLQGLQGNQGVQGLQGSQGVQGLQGLQGNQGTQGLQGTQGTQGTQGLQGLQGTQGRQGTQGLQGRQGLQGLQGNQGTQGTQGLQGLQGNQGLQGLQGNQGTQGLQGLQGNQGTQGLQGLQGNQGTQGLQGLQGNQGVQGVQGTQGLQGTQGNQGTQGLQGLQGNQGVQGTQGLQGVAPRVTISENPPSNPQEGDFWWDEDDGNLAVYYNDGDSNQWISAINSGAQGVSGIQGSSGGSGSTISFVGARLYHDGYAPPTAAAWTEVTNWDGTSIDTNSFVDSSNGFTIPAGVSKVRMTMGGKPSAGVSNQWTIRKNGSVLEVNDGGIFVEAESSGYQNGSVTGTTAVLSVSQGDTFDLRHYVSSTTQTWDLFFEIEVIEGDILGNNFTSRASSSAPSTASSNGYCWYDCL